MALSNPVSDAIGQKCATLKVSGDSDPTENIIYYAVRTTGPYLVGDGDVIRSGVGAVFTAQHPNISRQYALVTGLDSGTMHYWGAVKLTGNAVVATFTTQAEPVVPEDEAVFPPAGVIL